MKKRNDKKSPIASVILIIFAIVFFLYIPVSGIYSLVKMSDTISLDDFWEGSSHKSGQAVSGMVHYVKPYMTVDHSINFISAGSEYYYIIYNDDYTKCICVRAKKNWDEQFNNSGYSEEGVQIKGRLVHMAYDNAEQVGVVAARLDKQGIDMETAYYIDDTQEFMAYISIIWGIFVIVDCIIFMRKKMKRHDAVKSSADKAVDVLGIVLLAAICVLAIYILEFKI